MHNLDANANYSIIQEVSDFLRDLDLSRLGNPSSIHWRGQRARALVESARDSVRSLLRLEPKDQVIFTSGATEANNMAINSALGGKPAAGQGFLATSIEHPCVLEYLNHLRGQGASVSLVGPDERGYFSSDDFLRAAPHSPSMAAIMLANNETGLVLPASEIFASLRAMYPHVALHGDAAQALGKMDIDFSSLGADTISISGHKIGALSGVGALIVRHGSKVEPLLRGGPQENRLRAGTENVIGIASFGIACDVARRTLDSRIRRMRYNRDFLRGRIERSVPSARFTLSQEIPCLPNTLSVRIPGVRADDFVVALDLIGIAASSGAACSSGKQLPSSVLLAMGIPDHEARETVRFSFEGDKLPDIERLASAIVDVIGTFYVSK